MINKVSELEQYKQFSKDGITIWNVDSSVYRYEKKRMAVGKRDGNGSFDWFVVSKNDLTTAKKMVMRLVNEELF
jgi:hypothetical protein